METNLFSILKSSLILASLLSGSFFIIKAAITPSITGSIVGAQISSNYMVLGVFLFMVSLVLAHHSDAAQ